MKNRMRKCMNRIRNTKSWFDCSVCLSCCRSHCLGGCCLSTALDLCCEGPGWASPLTETQTDTNMMQFLKASLLNFSNQTWIKRHLVLCPLSSVLVWLNSNSSSPLIIKRKTALKTEVGLRNVYTVYTTLKIFHLSLTLFFVTCASALCALTSLRGLIFSVHDYYDINKTHKTEQQNNWH